jgi:hypothetical protein
LAPTDSISQQHHTTERQDYGAAITFIHCGYLLDIYPMSTLSNSIQTQNIWLLAQVTERPVFGMFNGVRQCVCLLATKVQLRQWLYLQMVK